MSAGADGNRALTAQYEQLRGDAVNGTSLAARGFGLALLLQQGMTGWMRACSEYTNELQRPAASSLPLAAPLPAAVRSQLTLILASMLMRPAQETHP